MICMHCGDKMKEILHSEKRVIEGKFVVFNGLRKSKCLSCNFECVTSDQLDKNYEIVSDIKSNL